MNLDVILSPPEIDLLPQRDLSHSVAVVFDILRATSTMITALANGAAGIWPVRSIEEAMAWKKERPAALLGGERFGELIEGFDLGNSPLEYQAGIVAGHEIISTTTNGTIALRAAEHAQSVLAASILNIAATAAHIGARPLVIVAAGTFREAALEDIVAAGLLISLLPGHQLTDSAQVSLALYKQNAHDLPAALRSAKNGRALIAKARSAEVDYCAQPSIYNLVAEMNKEGFIRKLA